MKSILIIEDEKQLREALSEKFQKEGFEVVLAEDGKDALNFLKNKKADLIILDLLMPKMDGITFYYKLQNDLKMEIPTIILTNLSEAVYPSSIKEFLLKSDTSLDEIVEKVRKHI